MPAKKAASKKGPKNMTAAHKAALAEGRTQGAAIRDYLKALDEHKPKRGRKRTPESIKKRLDRIDAELDSADVMKKVALYQERINLVRELAAGSSAVDLAALEKGFIKNAKAYSKRKGITYAAWREAGVSAATLSAAGISRGKA